MVVTSLGRGRGLIAMICLGLVGCPAPVEPTTGDAGSDGGPVLDGATDAGIDSATGDTGTDAGPTPECTAAADCDDGNTCTGDETCSAAGDCVAGTALAAGADCDADGDPATADICVASACAATRCGDMFVDTAASEECDDGNDVSGDGCDDCRFSCTLPTDCDDGVACTGVETCSAAHICQAGTNLPDGTACSGATGRCVSGGCLPNSCTTGADCADADVCNGVETCGTTGCAAGPALSCDDSDACTADACAAATGCSHTLIDVDGDGHAAASLGACGDDCDDTRADVGPDAPEVCGNTIDDDCDGMVDEGGATTWYADCDADGYAATGAHTLSACATPATGLSMCASGGGWTARSPATASDCNDGNATVHPTQAMFQTTAIAGAPMSSDYDYDCNGTEETRTSVHGACTRTGFACAITSGWETGTGPACGASAPFITRCDATVLGCTVVTESRPQACR